MTDLQINQLIAEYCGWNWYAVEKGGWYYRPDGHGYTNRISEAGKYSKEDANAEIVKGEPMSIVPIPFPDYCNDLNAMHEAMKTLSEEQVDKVWETLCDMIPFNSHSFRNGLVFDAPAKVRAEAFLRVIGKWEQ